MDLVKLVTTVLAICIIPAKGSRFFDEDHLPNREDLLPNRGQAVCRGGTQKPCYKVVYFHDVSRRYSFEEAHHACRSEGGYLVSIESENEQKLIQQIIQGLGAGDGDFWIGLRRKGDKMENSGNCPSLYAWMDGSNAKFRNWYIDEPSCGSEVCVVMYHQPSASVGPGGPYMFQWNDDRCNVNNNFICKYSEERIITSSTTVTNSSHVDVTTESLRPKYSDDSTVDTDDKVTESKDNMLNIIYILVPTIPLLFLLAVATTLFCFWLFMRRKERTEISTKEYHFWMSPLRSNSPNLEIYNVIRKQNDADLTGTRPDTKNISFRTSTGDNMSDNLSGEYDNMAGNTSESGCGTLASAESGFVTNEIYEISTDQTGKSKQSGWVENEIYGC
ncbi:layilin isoform X2 [Protopterus annectens]|uniref:layilin isoform X2 n=1 Tax=Protopterus annectens TaxID=7888 RepID=UPI001CF9FFB2|nr:layilin isoform X2 [Protopterus annectens]